MGENQPLGLIVGTSLLESDFFSDFDQQTVSAGDEPVTLFRSDEIIALQRHHSPEGDYRAPHAINHDVHMDVLKDRGVDRVFSVQSVGSLGESIRPGSLVVPDDFLNPWQVVTSYDDERGHQVVEFDDELRDGILTSLDEQHGQVHDGGVYVQTLGPRFESPAEAHLLAEFGDIVGMTAVSELILAAERGMRYASLCSVDNYVNGIADTELTLESFRDSVQDHRSSLLQTVETVLQSMAA